MKEKRKGERRKITTDYKRRKYDRRSKSFFFERTAYLTDTNMFGNVYFAQYFDLQGEAREEFFKYFMGNDYSEFVQKGYGLMTVEANMKYKQEVFVYDEIIIVINLSRLKKMKATLTFTFLMKKDNSLVGEGHQQLAFSSPEGKPIPVPEIVRRNAEPYALECTYNNNVK